MRLLCGSVLLCLALSALRRGTAGAVPAEWLKLIDHSATTDSTTAGASKKLEGLGEDVLPALRRAARRTTTSTSAAAAVLIPAIEKQACGEVPRFVGHTDGVTPWPCRPTASGSSRAVGTPTASRSPASGTSPPARRSTS